MKVAILITTSDRGGAQSHVFVLTERLLSLGVGVSLAVGDSGWLSDQMSKIGVKVTILRTLVHPIKPYKDFMAVLEVRNWLANERPDCLHCHSSKAGLVGRIAAATLRIPSVFTAHGWAFTGGASLIRKLIAIPLEKIAALCTAKVVCVSEYDFSRAKKFNIASLDTLEVIHNGIDDSEFRAGHVNQRPTIVCVARFAAPKQHLLLIDALGRMKDRLWVLTLVGDGPELAKVIREVKLAGLESRVQFLGARDDIPEILSWCDIFVLPSLYEGLPISIIEAMRAGLPVIASNVGGVSELVNSETGILVESEGKPSLEEALFALIEDGECRQQLGSAGRKVFECSFRSDEMVSRYMKIYQSVITDTQ